MAYKENLTTKFLMDIDFENNPLSYYSFLYEAQKVLYQLIRVIIINKDR